jgi:membrane fusion protein, heavy metal efflux system
MEKFYRYLLPVLCCGCFFLSGCAREKIATESAIQSAPSDSVHLSAKAIERFAVSSVTVQQRADNQPLATTGEVRADENRVFHINSLTSGRLIKDNVMLGEVIHPGQTLAVVQNLDVVKIYGDYIHQAHQNELDIQMSETRLALASKNYERLKSLYEDKIAAEKDLLKAEADKKIEEQYLSGLKEHAIHIKAEAKAMLLAYGVKLGDARSEQIESNSPITTPRGGVVIRKTVTVGDVVSSVEPLYVVADLSQVWLDIAIYDKQVQNTKIGNAITFTSDSLPGHTFTGSVSYINPSTDGTSGTFIARAVLANTNMLLKPGMLGRVQVKQATATKPFVPEDAVQKFGKDTFVFLDLGNGSYKKQSVVIGEHVGDGYLVDQGVRAGDRIVEKGSFTLKAEMLKSTMAGEEN